MKQTLITLVENKPGVLHRISSLFRRRNYNIESVVSGHSETPEIARMTIIANEGNAQKRGSIYYNLLKLVNVIAVKDVTNVPCVLRECALIKVASGPDRLNQLNDVAKKHNARIVDMGYETTIIEITEIESTIDQLIKALDAFEILEIMRTGVMAMRCGKTHRVDSEKINENPDDFKWVPEQVTAYKN